MSKKPQPRRYTDVEAMAKVRTLRTSARKLNLVAQSIRGLKVQRALNELDALRPPRRVGIDDVPEIRPHIFLRLPAARMLRPGEIERVRMNQRGLVPPFGRLLAGFIDQLVGFGPA